MKKAATDNKLTSHSAGIWVDIEDIGDESLEIGFVKEPSFCDLKDRDVKIAGNIIVNCTLNKCDTDIYLNGRVSTLLEFVCSRCLDNFTEGIDTEFSAEYIPEKTESPKEEVELLKGDFNISYYKGEKIDILPLIRDQILLSVRIKPLCKEDCLGLCPYCGRNLNAGKCSCKTEDVDERLAVLQRLKIKYKK